MTEQESPTTIAIRKIREDERDRIITIIAQWANDEGIPFDATNRLSRALGLEPNPEPEANHADYLEAEKFPPTAVEEP